MIGYVTNRNGGLFPTISIHIFDRNNDTHRVSAFIDTGFSGDMTLARQTIQKLRPKKDGIANLRLADGNIVSANAYVGLILWHGKSREVRIFEAENTPLIGMSLIKGSVLNIQAVAGGPVHINKIPQH